MFCRCADERERDRQREFAGERKVFCRSPDEREQHRGLVSSIVISADERERARERERERESRRS